jgi:hypothetical protein
MSDVPPELRPETTEEYERRKRRMWFGLGIPTLIGSALAIALSVPWWIVAIFIAIVASGLLINT